MLTMMIMATLILIFMYNTSSEIIESCVSDKQCVLNPPLVSLPTEEPASIILFENERLRVIDQYVNPKTEVTLTCKSNSKYLIII